MKVFRCRTVQHYGERYRYAAIADDMTRCTPWHTHFLTKEGATSYVKNETERQKSREDRKKLAAGDSEE